MTSWRLRLLASKVHTRTVQFLMRGARSHDEAEKLAVASVAREEREERKRAKFKPARQPVPHFDHRTGQGIAAAMTARLLNMLAGIEREEQQPSPAPGRTARADERQGSADVPRPALAPVRRMAQDPEPAPTMLIYSGAAGGNPTGGVRISEDEFPPSLQSHALRNWKASGGSIE
jgi:hypothetical protein